MCFCSLIPRLYNLRRKAIAELLAPLLRLPHISLQNRAVLVQALQYYSNSKAFNFEDAHIIVTMEQTKVTHIISYDTDFDKLPFIIWEEPTPVKNMAS